MRRIFKKYNIIIYIIILSLQFIVMFYWGNVKTNFFVDELFSMGYADGFFRDEGYPGYIYNCPEFTYNKWIKNSSFQQYLILSDEDKIFDATPLRVISGFMDGRSYFGLLNIAESLTGLSHISSKSALYLNLVFFSISELGLASLLKKLKINTKLLYLSLIMYGFSTYVISAVEYIRFYMMVIMLLIILLNCLYILWNSDDLKTVVVMNFLILSFSIISYKNSELTIIFLVFFLVCFFVLSCLQRKKRQAISSLFLGITCLLYVAISSQYIEMLFNPNEYLNDRSVAVNASLNISHASFTSIWLYFKWVKDLLGSYYFGSNVILLLFVALLMLGLTLDSIFFKLKFNKQIDELSNFHSSKGNRHKDKFSFKSFNSDKMYIVMVSVSILLYTIFCAMCGYRGVWRYYCLGFISLTIIIWYITDNLVKKINNKNIKCALFCSVSLLVVISSMMPFSTRKVEYMFENERDFVNSIHQNASLDIVMYIKDIDKTRTLAGHEFYDCIAMVPPDTNILLLDYDGKCEIDFPDKFMLWNDISTDMTAVLDELVRQGYSIETVGEDRCSQVHICSSSGT